MRPKKTFIVIFEEEIWIVGIIGDVLQGIL